MSGEGITKKISKICFYSLNCLNQRTFLGHKTEFDLLQKDEKTYISFIVRQKAARVISAQFWHPADIPAKQKPR